MQSETIRGERHAHYLGLMGCLAVLVMASEAGAGGLCPKFSEGAFFAAGNSPRSIAVADLDGDSVPDLVTANFFSADVSVLLGNGDGSFQAAASVARGDRARSVAAADLNGDSVPDLVTTNLGSTDVSVLLGNGDGSFQAAAFFATGVIPVSIAVADLDGDSIPDLVIANEGSDDVSVLLGNGDGSFQAALFFAVGDRPTSVAAADLNGDSVPDLVTANFFSDNVSVLLGNGDGSFQAALFFAAGDFPNSIAVADLDGDSVPDLATANRLSDNVSVLLGNGDGSFQAALFFTAGDSPSSVAVADLEGDSVPDLVIGNIASDDVSVLLGNGDGSFQAAVSFAVGDAPNSIAVADLDGDSGPDIVTANLSSDDVSVLINRCVSLVRLDIDIKPESCPNALNVKSKGVLPVAVLGTEGFDVREINTATIRLEGVTPIRSAIGDVSTPLLDKQDECDRASEDEDGFDDLTLEFDTQEVVSALGRVADGDELVLIFTAESSDGRPVEGKGRVTILSKHSVKKHVKDCLCAAQWENEMGAGDIRTLGERGVACSTFSEPEDVVTVRYRFHMFLSLRYRISAGSFFPGTGYCDDAFFVDRGGSIEQTTIEREVLPGDLDACRRYLSDLGCDFGD
jgi:hypothetical protein